MRLFVMKLIVPALLLTPGLAGAFPVTFGTSWDNVPLQQILDQHYGPGAINVATQYEGYSPGDADPPYWVDQGVSGLIIREIAGFKDRNTMGWYAETLQSPPVIDGINDGVIFDGPLGAGGSAVVNFPGGVTRFGFYLNPDGLNAGGGYAPEPEMFFTNRFYNDIGPAGAGATHAPFDGDPQVLVFNVSHLYNGVPTYVLAWEDLDYGAPVMPYYSWMGTDNDFNDMVVEIQAVSPVTVETQSWGSVKALFRQ
ncbi:DUF4114 domain-containing protein [bacterium]|nr:DUF4114 domain-containing protein [bacterium]